MAQGALDVWMNGELVGSWYTTRTGTPVLRYDEAWLRSPNVRPLSLSLPIPLAGGEVRGQAVENYFDNLLPESEAVRERVRRRFHCPSLRAADLLAAIGRDCVGAVQLLPAGSEPPQVARLESEALDEAAVEQLLLHATSDTATPDEHEELRISIAGAQEKTALLRKGTRWHRPLGATPTTHIFKLPLGPVGGMRADMSFSVENEWLCAQILRELGLPVADTRMATFGRQKALVVERFDRRWMDGKRWVARLPQEDFCQACGVPARSKYESDGGPGMAAGLSLLNGSEDASGDKLRFALAQLAFWLMAAIDGHAKNFSIFVLPKGAFRATPLYDVLSAWPIIGEGAHQLPARRARMAMAVRSTSAHYRLHEIQSRHWRHLAAQTVVAGAFEAMQALVAAVPASLERVQAQLPAGFPSKVFKPIRAGMLAQARKFREGLQ